MNWLTDDVLFYGGLAAIIFTLVLMLVYTIISGVMASRLQKKLKLEYGEKPEEKV